jgi:hypothetical protein
MPVKYQVAGMQQLIDAVRQAGADQPVMVGGLNWASDLCQEVGAKHQGTQCLWLKYKPEDPAHQIVASFHNYNFISCTTVACWNSNVGVLAQMVPVVTGELGEKDCSDNYVNRYMHWADRHDISYLAWAWQSPAHDDISCQKQNLDLVEGQSGDPNPGSRLAADFKAHLEAEASTATSGYSR